MDASDQSEPARTAAAELARLERLLRNIDIGYEEFSFLYRNGEVTDVLRATAEGFFRITFNVMLDWLILQLGKLHKSSQERAVTLESALERLKEAGVSDADLAEARTHARMFAKQYQQYKAFRDRAIAHMDWQMPKGDIGLELEPLIDTARQCVNEMKAVAGLGATALSELPPAMNYRAPHLIALLSGRMGELNEQGSLGGSMD